MRVSGQRQRHEPGQGRRGAGRAGPLVAIALGAALGLAAAGPASAQPTTIYWTVGGTPGGVQRATLTGTGTPAIEVLPIAFGDPRGLVLDPGGGFLYVGTGDESDHLIARADLDGLGLTGLVARVPGVAFRGVSEGIAIDPQALRVYWTEIQSEQATFNLHDFVRRARLSDGAAPLAQFRADVNHNPRGVVLDSDGDPSPDDDVLYWVSGDGVIRKQTGEAGVTVLAPCHEPRAIVLDRAAGRLYWTESVATGTQAVLGLGRIRTVRTDGAGGVADVRTALDLPVALALDPGTGGGAGRLFYGTDVGGIFEVDLATSAERFVLDAGAPVHSLAVLFDPPPPSPRSGSDGGGGGGCGARGAGASGGGAPPLLLLGIAVGLAFRAFRARTQGRGYPPSRSIS